MCWFLLTVMYYQGYTSVPISSLREKEICLCLCPHLFYTACLISSCLCPVQLDQLVIDSAMEKREMEHKHALIQQRVRQQISALIHPCPPPFFLHFHAVLGILFLLPQKYPSIHCLLINPYTLVNSLVQCHSDRDKVYTYNYN